MTTLTANIKDTKRFDFTSEAPGYADDAKAGPCFDVVELAGAEEISRGFRFELTLVSNQDVDCKTMLKHYARFNLHGLADTDKQGDNRAREQARTVFYRGRLEAFEQLNTVGAYHFYRAVLVPRVEILRRVRISDVYVGQKMTDIFKAVLDEENCGISSSDYDLDSLGAADRTLPFVCQYQESHLDFLYRLMEREGFYHFMTYDQAKSTDTWKVVDKMSNLPSEVLEFTYLQDGKADQYVNGLVNGFTCHHQPLAHRVVLQNYDPLQAKLNLRSTSVIDEDGVGDVMLHGENFSDETVGNTYAERRAQELRWQGEVYEGAGSAVGLRCGHFMKLSGQVRDAFKKEFMVMRVVHEGSQAATLLAGVGNNPYSAAKSTFYRNTFKAIRHKNGDGTDNEFRPLRVTPKPVVAGSFSATVEGETNDGYAQPDADGNYRIRLKFGRGMARTEEDAKAADTEKGKTKFQWHAAGKASAAVRLSVPYAGNGYGMHFPLLEGAEVLLSFMDGDLDRPYIVNAAPNSESKSQVTSANRRNNIIRSAQNHLINLIDDKDSADFGILLQSAGGAKTHLTKTDAGFFSPSSSTKLTVGATNKMAIGPSSSVSMGTDASFGASLATKVTFGMSLSYNLSQDIKWVGEKSKSVSVDDSDSFSFKTKNVLHSRDFNQISAGFDFKNEAQLELVDQAKKKLGKSIAIIAGVNFALSATMAATQSAVGKKSETKFDDPSATKTFGLGLGTMIGQMTGNVLTTSVGVALATKTFAAVAEAYKKVKPSSNIRMDKDGIRDTYEGAATFAEQKSSNDGVSLLAMPVASWTALNAAAGTPVYPPMASAAAQPKVSSLKMDGSGAINVFAGTKVDMTTKTIGLKADKFRFDGTRFKSSVEFSDTKVLLTTDTDRQILMGSNGVKISSRNLDPTKGTVSVGDAEVSATCGTAGIKVSSSALALSLGGSKIDMKPVGLSMFGSLIKLG